MFRGGGVWKNTFAEHPDGLDHFLIFGEYNIWHILMASRPVVLTMFLKSNQPEFLPLPLFR